MSNPIALLLEPMPPCSKCDEPSIMFAGKESFCALHGIETMLAKLEELDEDDQIVADARAALEMERDRRRR